MKNHLLAGVTRLCKATLVLIVSVSLVLNLATPAFAQEEAEAVAPAVQSSAASMTEVDGVPVIDLQPKLDLNYAMLRRFRELPGFYPTLGQKIIKAVPFDSVEDVVNIDGLTDKQVRLLRANFNNFVVGDYDEGANDFETRLNKGFYD
ncbi:MAG: photosystem II complex extrinsic protein PsbU [Cyanobacteria bacterium P01_A01_bin.3]